jgi:hypothetical protein
VKRLAPGIVVALWLAGCPGGGARDVAADAGPELDVAGELPTWSEVEVPAEVAWPEEAFSEDEEEGPAVDEAEEADPEPQGDAAPDVADEEAPLDPTLDSDGDGVPDVQEIADGTDPANPASAGAWHPEWTEHPRLFFGPEDVPELLARTSSPPGPWATLWSRIHGAADATPPEPPAEGFDIYVDPARGAIAEAAAFVGLVTADAAYTQKAIDLLAAGFADPSELPADSNYDLTEAEALVSFCAAWDYVAGNPLADADALAAAREGLVHRIDVFRTATHEGALVLMMLFSRNNHVMKVLGALGLCGMAVNDRPEAATDLSEAMTGLDWLMNAHQGSEGGGYAEGWNYLSYGGASYLPFFAAYHRWAKGETRPYYGVPLLQADGTHAGRVDPIQDFATNPFTAAIYRRALWSTGPDGLMPQTDDANPASLHGGLLYALYGDPDFLWQWTRPAGGIHAARAETATFAMYDGTEAPAHPSLELEGSAPGAGFAVFRDSWGPDALHLVLQGEHGVVRDHGAGHEHADELSFLMWAHGELLILDPGYISWPNHDKVKYATDHNTILVDGVGSPYEQLGGLDIDIGADSFLGPMQTDGPATWVEVTTAYAGAGFARRVVRVDGRLFVVEDAIDGGGGTHAYSLLLNGMAGGDVAGSTFTLLPDGAAWDRTAARVEAHVLPLGGDGSVTVSNALEEHQAGFGKWAMHERLNVEATLAAPAGFLTLLVPGVAGAPPWDLATATPAPGIAAASLRVPPDGTLVRIVANHTGATAEVALAGRTDVVPPGLLVRVGEPETASTANLTPLVLPAAPPP